MPIAEMILTATVSLIVGFIWGHYHRISDHAVRLFQPHMAKRFDQLIKDEAALEPRMNAVGKREDALMLREFKASARERELEQATHTLEGLQGDEARQRVIWLAEQLSAHLQPDGVARMVSRESGAVDAERGDA